MKCFFPGCSIGAGRESGALFRINAKGVPGIWACHKHRQNTDAPRNPELDKFVLMIEREMKP